MLISKVTKNTFQFIENFEDILFEGIWEVPKGVSINSFLIKGDKVAMIDGLWGESIPGVFLNFLEEEGIGYDGIDYLIVNHMEPDHSGWINAYRKINPNVKIYCNSKSKSLLEAFSHTTEGIIKVDEETKLDLGQGHELSFVMTPNVHWPDNMATFDSGTNCLFSCDAFGSFGSVERENYDDMLNDEEILEFLDETDRYYSNIVASFSSFAMKAVENVKNLKPAIIAPGHGLVWRKDPDRIVKIYEDLASYASGKAEEKITFIWGSMYGMTGSAVERIVNILKDENINFEVLRVPQTNVGDILRSAWRSSGIILGMPTYEYKMFPPMAEVLDELGRKKLIKKKAFRYGSYGWHPGAERELSDIMERNRMNWDFLPSVEYNGKPREEDLNLIEERVRELVESIRKDFK